MIVVVDCGMCNLGSVLNMFRKIGAECIASSDSRVIRGASKLVLPGVGAFDSGMGRINELGLADVFREKAADGIPFLGICLGMQLLTKRSEEGKLSGLGLIDAETVKFRFEGMKDNFSIPHMGWNKVSVKKECRLFKDKAEERRFYFVHSYHVVCSNTVDVAATTRYGFDFTSALQRDNVYGVQFHPEKSHKFGMNLLKNFVEL